MPCATWSKPGALRVRPVLAETGNAGINDARIGFLQRFVIDAEPELHVGAEILDHHVGAVGELAENLQRRPDPSG